mmetsp:Transcript_23003/g.37876  ORF Transcript_23003/g.37876 Transcript_23003/m.37876 type:complete len:87 (-) Transcript_23003:601-861(-)|eukprot:scaffold2316_cov135-Skeletonema_menzelii.AAC.2
MLKSFISNSPTTDHKEQLIVLATVKGRGMAAADLVAITSLSADNGLAKRSMKTSTPSFPTISVATFLGNRAATKTFNRTIQVIASL